jgi:serine/threonine-protein kinase
MSAPVSDPNDADQTRMSDSSAASQSGWLSTSGSIDHGRFTPGAILDNRYRIVGLLGRGGMGEVYRADDLRLGQPVAIKLLPAALARDPKRLAQFHNEVRTARQVSHPNVCRVHDIGEVDGQLFLTMEFVDGEDLAASVKRVGRFPQDKALDLARQISSGLAAAHDRGIIHRDLKPANIMLDRQGAVRLMDFGLAAVGDAEDVRAGTPAYMAPEQLAGTGVSVKSDIYALGLVLYELFTGKRAFTARSLDDLMTQQASGDIAPPSQVVKDLDPAVDAAIMRCLERDATRRPASALAVAAALPGADPLAAAIAAGETPSPEMVAAAGKAEPVWRTTTVASVTAAIAVLLLATMWLCDRTTLLSKIPLEYAPATLADRARDLERQFGYTTNAYRASGHTTRDEVIAWLRRDGRQAQLDRGGDEASLVSFWYRSAPYPLVPDGAAISNSDPVPYQPGMTFISMDPAGRLLAFHHAPVSADAPGDAPAAPPWPALFDAAGYDVARFTPTEPQGALRLYADSRAAWSGTLPGHDDVPVRVEAAAFHGRPVAFTVIGPWNSSAAVTAPTGGAASTSIIATIATALVVPGVILAAAFAARANLRAGRGDRRGAARLAGLTFIVTMLGWVFGAAHFGDPSREVDRFFQATGVVLFNSALVWLFYLAAEPRVRKIWPHILITWSRLTNTGAADPLVGRDLLVGVLAGTLMTVISYLFYLLPLAAGWTPFASRTPGLYTLTGSGLLAAKFFETVANALQNATLGVVGLALLRGVIRREALTFLAATAIFTPLAARGQFQSGIAALDLLFGALLVFLILGVLFRFGLVAGIVGFTAHFWTFGVPLTLDPSRQYFSQSVLAVAIISVLAAAGILLIRGRASAHAGPY